MAWPPVGGGCFYAILTHKQALTHAAGVDTEGGSLADVLGGVHPGRLQLGQIIKPLAKGLDLAPASLELASCELGLTSRLGREGVLKKSLATLSGYDLAILDCGPSLGLLVVNSLTATNSGDSARGA